MYFMGCACCVLNFRMLPKTYFDNLFFFFFTKIFKIVQIVRFSEKMLGKTEKNITRTVFDINLLKMSITVYENLLIG